MTRRKTVRGQVILEAVIAIPLVIWLLGMGLDLLRRVQLHAIFHHAACRLVRERVLYVPRTRLEPRAATLVESLMAGALKGNEFQATIPKPKEQSGRGTEVRLHHRYPAFVPFPWRGGTKHHMEVTERCFFPIG